MNGIYRFINTNVPTLGCNLRCDYCYIRQHGDEDILDIKKRDSLFKYSVEHMISALTVERLGGVCMFNISGSGETLLCPDIFEICEGLLRNGHYIAIISNCTVTKEIEKFIRLKQEYRDRLFFKASFHYQELKRRNLLNTYASNINALKKNGIAFSIEIVSNDGVLSELEELKAWTEKEFGALPHVLAGRSETKLGEFPKFETCLSEEEFFETWDEFKSPLFDYQYTDYVLPHNDEFCHAGVYTGSLEMATGVFFACPGNKKITNMFENTEEPIRFAPMAKACPFPYCFCGFFLQVLAGACNESYNPNVVFGEFRDRKCTDGSHWLTPSIKEVFSHKCSEFHNPLTSAKKTYLNALMKKRYGMENEINIDEYNEVTKEIKYKLKSLKIDKVVIYGYGGIGQLIYDILNDAGIEVVALMDKRYKEIEAKIPVYSPEDAPKEGDAIIVSIFYDYTEIAPKLRNITEKKILSVIDII
ncbi:MAG: radical SAM protein [Pseudobutyrivibrio sp.]|nr:radical SAM protein [Pseudobutyrivibrio sp.]